EGKVEIEVIEFQLREVVEGIADIFSERALSKGLKLFCYVAPEIPSVVIGDPTRLRQILINLLGNATKFTGKGHVLLEVTPAPTPGWQEERQIKLHFKISDTGIGISPEIMSKLFQKFSQADSSTTRKYGGTGLGLTISKSLVELMGGNLWAESTEGAGSSFQFALTLPVPVSAFQLTLPELQGRSALIIHENAAGRVILKKLLSHWGLEITAAASAREAAALLHDGNRHHFDIIFVDHDPPGLSGHELAQQIRLLPAHRDSKIVILSSLVGSAQNGSKKTEVAAEITKPITSLKLYRSLKSVFNEKANGRAELPGDEAGDEVTTVRRQSKILLVEDNIDNQQLARNILEKSGHQVEVAENGQMALAAATTYRYHLILMDIQMPIMDGFEVTRKIRAWEREQALPATPIVALTAHAITGYREKCLAHEMNDYLTKPITKKALLSKVAEWIDRHKRILIVDDQQDNRTLVKHFLEGLSDCQLVFACNGNEAIEQYQRQDISLVIVDVEMPRLDGLAATRLIRKSENGKHVPIVALTAHEEKDKLDSCHEAGCTHYLTKPLRKKELLDTIQKLW
ncbi:MAG TPA: response regulator, partial [bacterium]